jgi:hypothetical protein
VRNRRTIARIAVTLAVAGSLGLGTGATSAYASGPNTTIVPGKGHGCGYVTTGALWWKKTVWRCW